MTTQTKIYTNASNTARAAKAELSKARNVAKDEIQKGVDFDVIAVEGGFQWVEIKAAEEPAQEEPKGEVTKTALKIQKDREERNDIKRPSAGGKCAQLWELFEAMYGEKGIIPTPKPAKERSAELGLDPVTTTVQLYRWRQFMGFKK